MPNGLCVTGKALVPRLVHLQLSHEYYAWLLQLGGNLEITGMPCLLRIYIAAGM